MLPCDHRGDARLAINQRELALRTKLAAESLYLRHIDIADRAIVRDEEKNGRFVSGACEWVVL